MPFRVQLLLFLLLLALSAQATTITWTGPTYAKGANEGQLCTPGTPQCILGSPAYFQVWSMSLTWPTLAADPWHLVIETNYGDPMQVLLPTTTPYDYWGSGYLFSVGDVLIQWNGNKYGVVIFPHDGFDAARLYQTSYYQTSEDILTGKTTDIVNPFHPVWIGLDATPKGNAGTASSAVTGDAYTAARYTIDVDFYAPADFLSHGSYSVEFTSYACANGVLKGTGYVPEPATWLMLSLAPAVFYIRRRCSKRS